MLNLYRASAGSGKTHQLTGDYIRLLFADGQARPHRRMLAVTFTNKATDEMKLRIITELHRLAGGAPSDYRELLQQQFTFDEQAVNKKAHELLKEILHDYGAFSIQTIDRFFQQVLRSFMREIGLHGGYNIEIETDEPLSKAIDGLLFALSEPENRQLFNWLMSFAQEQIENGKGWNIKNAVVTLGTELFKESYKKKLPEVREKLHDRTFLMHYRQQLAAVQKQFEAVVASIGKEACELIKKHGLTPADFKGAGRSPFFFFEKLANKKIAPPSNTFLELAGNIDNWSSAKATDKAAIEAVYDAGLNDLTKQTVRQFGAPYIDYRTAITIVNHLYTLGILADIDRQMRSDLEESNRLLLSDTTELLAHIVDGNDTPFIFEKTGTNIHHLMIDEFQDSSAMQWQNFKPLLQNSLAFGNENLIVGDVKQSIYRWRNSDWQLLDKQLFIDFSAGQIHEEYLSNNWRSGRTVIDFNNTFFTQASAFLQQLFNDAIPPEYIKNQETKVLTHRLSDAYKGLIQRYPPHAKEGHVQVTFFPSSLSPSLSEGGGERSEMLRGVGEKLILQIEQWQSKGFALKDIAILVRTNKEAAEVASFLLNHKNSPQAKPEYRYDVISNEALIIGNALTVKFLIETLRYVLHPDERLLQAVVTYLYYTLHEGKSPHQALQESFNGGNEAESVRSTLQKIVKESGNRSLFELNDTLIHLFDLGKSKNEQIFLQAFQDVVHQFSLKESAGIASFLEWWDTKGSSKTISMPDTQDAIRVVTIHKSKGLGFEAVIIPFFDWSIDNPNRPILWCQPATAPFDALPLVPVAYSSQLAETHFAQDYWQEKMATFIDNLNVAYVAFTRAKQELAIFAPQPAMKKDGSYSINSMGAILYKLLSEQADNQQEITDSPLLHFSSLWNEEKLSLELGGYLQQTAPVRQENQVQYAYQGTEESAGRLSIKYRATDFLVLDNNIPRKASLNYGTLMHDILRTIRQKGDELPVINSLEKTGRISADEKKKMLHTFDSFWNMKETGQWFSPDAKIYTERSVFAPNGDSYVPDRVVIKDGKAMIIDYKFGRPHAAHYRQVANYMQLIRSMNYAVEGFLCYVTENRVEPVSTY